ncbi:g10247 [Coccomyxa elongata]
MVPVNFAVLQGSLTRPDLVREMAYLERLLYKNKQQHRSSRHFQQLLDVHRCLQLWRRLDLQQLMAELAEHAKLRDSAREAQWLPNPQRQQPSPSAQLLLQRIIAGCRMMGLVQTAAHKAASALSAQLALTFFMPLCLTAIAILARVRVLAGQWVLDAVAAYNMLIDYLPTLPQDITDGGNSLPQLLKAEWRGSLPHAVQLPYEAGDSYAKRVLEHAASRPAQLPDRALPEARLIAAAVRADESRETGPQKNLPAQGAKARSTAAKEQPEHPASLPVFEDRDLRSRERSPEANVPLYVSSGALTGAPSSLGMGDAFAALTGGTALPVQPPNAASVPPLGQPLEAFRWREPLISDGCTSVFGAAQESQGRTPAEMGGIFGEVTVLASAPPELPAEVPAQHELRTPGVHATTLPDQSSAALGSSPAGLGDQGGLLPVSPGSGPPQVAEAASGLLPVSPGSGPPQVAEAASQNAEVQEDAREHATSRAQTAAAPLDGAVSARDVLCLDNSKQGVVSEREHMVVAALDMVVPRQQQHAEALPEVPCDHASSPALYHVLPVLGLALGAAEKGVDSPAAHLTPGTAGLPGVPASAEARAPSPQLAEPPDSARDSEGTPLYDVLLPTLGSHPAQVPTPALGQAALPASMHPQPAGEVAKDAPGAELVGEAHRMLPESKAGQKRARQAAAAQQAKPQLPAKRSWEEWLQPGASTAAAPGAVRGRQTTSRGRGSQGGRSGLQISGRGRHGHQAKKRR